MSALLESLNVAKKIMVYDVTGSGKTTLARWLSEATGLPWFSVDDLTWETSWTPIELEIQRQRICKICSGEEWIHDSAYGTWLDRPLARVALIHTLDYVRAVSLWRLA